MPLSFDKAAVLTIGDEILEGRTRDINLMQVSRGLSARGIPVFESRTVADRTAEIAAAIRDLGSRGRLVVTTGGLGPTDDDMTLPALAEALGLGMEPNPRAEAMVRRRMSRLGRSCPESALKQAVLPAGGRPVVNPVGVAPGVALVHDGCGYVCLPGVPSETEALLAPCLDALGISGAAVSEYELLRTWGIRENDLFDRLAPRARKLGCSLAFLPSACRVDVKVFGDRRGEMAAAVERELTGHVYSRSADLGLPQRLGEELKRLGLGVCVAESCTGGMLGEELTSVPGASEWFCGGVVSYSNRIKTDLLGVDGGLIESKGAVSIEVAAAMAFGARRLLGAEASMAVTGIAGPSGGTPAKPVGTVCMAVEHPGGFRRRIERFGGDRQHVRRSSVTCVTGMLLDSLMEIGQ